ALEAPREIVDLRSCQTLVVGANCFVHRRERHVRITVVLVGDVDEAAEPRPRAQALWARQRAFDAAERLVRVLERTLGWTTGKRGVTHDGKGRCLAFQVIDRSA